MIHDRRREDVEVEGQHRRPAGARRALRRRRRADVHALPRPGRPGHGVARTPGIEGVWRFLNRLWRVALEQAAQAARRAAVDGPLARKAHETIAKVTDDIDRRFAFNTPIAAVMELVNEIASHPGRSGRALRRRDGRLADPAVRAAHRRGAVGAARAASGCGSSRGPSRIPRSSSATPSRSSCR